MDVQNVIKEYWPWMLGGVAGIFLITRMRSGASASSAPVYLQAGQSDAQIIANAQAEALRSQTALQTRQLDLAAQKQADELALQRSALEMQYQSSTDAARAANLTAAGAFLQSQGTAASSAGQAVSQVVSSLYAPAVAAIGAASAENSAALQTAALVASSSYSAQASALTGVTDVLGEFVKIPLAGQQAIGQIGSATKNKSTWETMMESAAKMYGAFQAGGQRI